MAGKSGDGSYKKLIGNIYGVNKSSISLTQKYQENDNKIRIDEFILQLPIPFSRSGVYVYDNGGLNRREDYGNFWKTAAAAVSKDRADRFTFRSEILDTQSSYIKNDGFSLRCVAKNKKDALDIVQYLGHLCV